MSKKADEKEKKIREIMTWILDNTHDQDAMDRISMLIFPYTSKYKQNRTRPSTSRVYHARPDDNDDVQVVT